MANMRRRNTAGADEIANAIHRMVDAMQPVAAPPGAMIPPVRPVTMEDFMRHKPAKFTGKATQMRLTHGFVNVRRYFG